MAFSSKGQVAEGPQGGKGVRSDLDAHSCKPSVVGEHEWNSLDLYKLGNREAGHFPLLDVGCKINGFKMMFSPQLMNLSYICCVSYKCVTPHYTQ